MALINCPECGQQVSDSAVFCPNCNYPLKRDFAPVKKSLPKNLNFIGLLILSLSIVILSIVYLVTNSNFFDNDSSLKIDVEDYYAQLTTSEKAVYKALTDNLRNFKDPTSVKVIGGKVQDGHSINYLLISAKNGFGGSSSDCYAIYTDSTLSWDKYESSSIFCEGNLNHQSAFNSLLKEYISDNY